jgi:hypothetical protein
LSDIVESCFGKYKELVKNNNMVVISDLSLCISAILGECTDIKGCFERISDIGLMDKIAPEIVIINYNSYLYMI